MWCQLLRCGGSRRRSGRVFGSSRRNIITGPRYTPIVTRLPSIVPFVAPEEMERARERNFSVRLGANEMTIGPSPKAVKAMQAAAADVWMYGVRPGPGLCSVARHCGVGWQHHVVVATHATPWCRTPSPTACALL
jgi:histidinol-phosphate/aromatic aminotransferase/cobyric acid decarboxylase-like protein